MTFTDKIKEIPIVDHAERMGYTVTKAGNKYYSLKEHDSVMIDPRRNCFWRNSTFTSGFKGGAGSIIDFVMEFEGYQTAREAIEELASEYGIERDNYNSVSIPKKERVVIESNESKREPGDLALPERDSNIDAAYNYLLNTRKINKEVINYFVENDMLYQDKKRNAVFKTEKFACLRSTGTKKFVMDAEGCDYNEGFFIKNNEDADTLVVSESVIDAMSIMSYYQRHGVDYKNHAYLALSGTNKLGSVFYHLDNQPQIKKVYIACDNDRAGQDATNKIIEVLEERYNVDYTIASPREGKDWNEYIVLLSEREQKQKNEDKLVEPQEVINFTYYSILRPVGPGTYPNEGMKEIENFDEKKFIEEIGREAYGSVTYGRMLSPAELDQYDLVAIPSKHLNLEQRLQGKQLEDARNMIDSLRETGNVVDEEKGVVSLYYSIDQKMANIIMKNKKIRSENYENGNGVLLSTEPEPLKEGDVVIELSIPVENVVLNHYDIETETATFYHYADERIFSVADYDIKRVETIPHREETEKQEETVKINEAPVNEESTHEETIRHREVQSFAGASKDEMKEHLVTGIQNIMNSDDYKNWLNTGSKLFYNNYSFNNAMLIWMQKEDATHVMGYEKWKDFGRAVQKGAKGAKILMPVMAYEKVEGGLFKMIVSQLEEQLKKDSSLPKADFRLFSSQVQFTMNRSGSIGLVINDQEKGIFPNHDEVKKFISNNILGKVPMKFTVGTVFDAKDTYVPEYLWVSKGFSKEELVLDDKGKPIKSKKGEYKIYNTPERQARFKPALDTFIVAKDPEKMKELMDVLKTVSEKNGIPVYMRSKDEDKDLQGAKGYFSRRFDEQHPKGFIVIDKNMEITEMCSVMLHEMGHSDMHGNLEKIAELSKELGEEATSNIRELQAESVAYMTASTFGIETSTSSFQYLANYAQGFDVQGLQKSMDAIYKECKKLTSEITEELESRGLNLDLSKKDPKQMISEMNIKKMSQEFMTFAIEREESLNDVLNELPEHILENKKDIQILSVLKQQKENILSQLDDISIIKEEVTKLETANNRVEQDNSVQILEKAKERIEMNVEDFEKLTDNFISIKNERKGTLKEEFKKSPANVIKLLTEQYPKMSNLSNSQLHYISTSEFIRKKYSNLLDINPEAFVNVVVKRAENLPNISSKKGSFVEINFCEKWTNSPVFKAGEICHPKVANTLIRNAEEQLNIIRKKAKESGEYFPYTKCNLTVYSTSQKGERVAFYTRIDIGDGTQKDLVTHLKSISSSNTKGLMENIISDIKEHNVKDKIVDVEITNEDLCVDEQNEIVENKVYSLDNWKKQIQDKKIEKNGNEKMENRQNSSYRQKDIAD